MWIVDGWSVKANVFLSPSVLENPKHTHRIPANSIYFFVNCNWYLRAFFLLLEDVFLGSDGNVWCGVAVYDLFVFA